MNNALNSHGLEQRVSHKGPLRDGFDIVVMEAPENIKNMPLVILSISMFRIWCVWRSHKVCL